MMYRACLMIYRACFRALTCENECLPALTLHKKHNLQRSVVGTANKQRPSSPSLGCKGEGGEGPGPANPANAAKEKELVFGAEPLRQILDSDVLGRFGAR